MSDPSYIALITLTLPGMAQPVQANVVLHPPDKVNINGELKPLADCTLAELQTFAEQLQQEVWETYQAISLEELVENEQVDIKILVSDETGEREIKILPSDEEEEMPQVAEPESAVPTETPEPQEETAVPAQLDKPADEEETADLPPLPTTEPVKPELVQAEPETGVIVSESQPVHEEREAPTEPPVHIPAPPTPKIRVAGKRTAIGTPTWAAVDILLDEPVLRDMQAHALSSMNREVAGVLVGPRPEKQPDGRYVVYVTDSIIAKHTIMQGASVTYTPESWRYMNDVLAHRYPQETAVMVGWYHTHPGFGIFLSGMDKFIHQNFFTQIWHVAYVLDPQARKSGFFCWDRAKSRVDPFDFQWPDWAATSW